MIRLKYMSSHNLIEYGIVLDGNRFLIPGNNHRLQLNVDHIVLNNVLITEVTSIRIALGNQHTDIRVAAKVPCKIPLELHGQVGSWYLHVLINGIDQYGYLQQIPFYFSRPIICTNYHPIYDARIGRSNWPADEFKTM
jgi:hypothetical protein